MLAAVLADRVDDADDEVRAWLAALWRHRDDRYSATRAANTDSTDHVAMSYIGG